MNLYNQQAKRSSNVYTHTGGIINKGGQLTEFGKTGTSGTQGSRDSNRRNLCDGSPTITKDNFILVDSQGLARRMDVGDSEGQRMPFVVQTIMEDDGTP